MARPQIIVNVSAALARRGAPTATGRAFVVYPTLSTAPAGPAIPVVVRSEAEALAAAVPAQYATWIGDILKQGAPDVVVVRAITAQLSTGIITQAELEAALATFSSDFGPGQVLAPGVATVAARAALLGHANTTGRTVLLDVLENETAASVVSILTALAASPGSKTAGLLPGWPKLPILGGGTRNVPGSVIAAGLAARGDAAVGHANHAPAGDQGRGAGFVTDATGVSIGYTDAELDSIHDAGGSVFRTIRGQVQLYGWKAVSSDVRFDQLNVGRMTMQLGTGIRAGAEAFLFRPIDGRGLLFAELEGFLRGYLSPLYTANALFGATADDAFDVDVAGANTPATITAGEVRANVAVRLTPHAEKVTISVVTESPEGA
ncbi:hypothetical protein [Nocardioides sp.]|uniref:hypothetical protein n=1 Tax=Nocardioides sp. TaxID=35761 RepID=UPI002B9ADD70|nr:hypothetical protein [Nocardioides sp.]HXH77315.1 hypothetical protein [Nocardioides sp.]